MALSHLPLLSHRLPHVGKGGSGGLQGPFGTVGPPQDVLHLLSSAASHCLVHGSCMHKKK